MKIALDYDNCYNRDPVAWAAFIKLMQSYGHEVRGVTARNIEVDRTAPLIEFESHCRVHYTNGVAKRFYCQMSIEDFIPDVWVDDRPESILENSRFDPEGLKKWRDERNERLN